MTDASTVTGGAAKVRVIRVDRSHEAEAALAGFYRRVWDRDATPASVRAARARAATANPVIPGEAPPTWIVLRGDVAIGHVTTIPVVMRLGGTDFGAYWLKGLWVLPEFQRSAVGFLLLREAVRGLDGSPLFGLAHEPAALRLFGAVGFTDLGALPNDLRVLRARTLLARLDLQRLGLGGMPWWIRQGAWLAHHSATVAGPAVDAGLAAWATIAARRRRGLTCESLPTLDRDDGETLWQSVGSGLQWASARGGSTFAARYPEDRYVFVHVRTGARLAGLGIVRRPREQGDPRLRGIRVCTVSDLLFPPADHDVGLAVLQGVEEAARTMGADAALCSASAAVVRSLCRRRGYVRLPGNLHVLTRLAASMPAPARLDEWWFTRGDSLGDEVF